MILTGEILLEWERGTASKVGLTRSILNMITLGEEIAEDKKLNIIDVHRLMLFTNGIPEIVLNTTN